MSLEKTRWVRKNPQFAEAFAAFAVSLGRLVREMREARGRSQLYFCEDIGCTQGHLSRLENARVVPDLAALARIGLELGYDLTVVFTRPKVEDRGVTFPGRAYASARNALAIAASWEARAERLRERIRIRPEEPL